MFNDIGQSNPVTAQEPASYKSPWWIKKISPYLPSSVASALQTEEGVVGAEIVLTIVGSALLLWWLRHKKYIATD